ncbi:hypothetical protein CBR_g25824 [Chara braunii]|uniref:Uncharacterized protein n=1 Tax=Chara braunii TaxID=69332 RepID=A0A388L6M4_CHABU|nr:hypothetical protein CBR_g25824 [Chara braunii]|eukprot:GBG77892.1 hypothetical protein CBR_g25824 [Chara braunii]
MMLRCTFCNKVFQGSQFQATRHFTQTNYCKDVSDEALYEIARRSQQKFESDQMERVAKYGAERGVDVPGTGGVRGGEVGRQPVEGASGGVGGNGGGGDTKEGAIDVDREARVPGERGVPGHEDVPEVYPGTGERMEDFLRRASKGPVGKGSSKRNEGGIDPAAAPAGKRHHQQKVTGVYAERNWAVHEGIHTKKRNQLAFEKVVQLVEITANVRLSEYRRAGCGYVLPWQRDEGVLDCQAGLELEPVRTGTRRGMTPEEIAVQEEGGPSAAAVEGEMAVEGGLAGTTIAGVVDQIAVAAAASLLEEMAASGLAEEAPAPGGADAVEGQAGAAKGAAGGADGGAAGGAAALDGLVAAAAGEARRGSDAVGGGMPGAVEEEIGAQAEAGRRLDEGVGDARCVVRETTTGPVVLFSGLHLDQGRQSQPVLVAVHGVPPAVITDLGSEPLVAPLRLPSHFAPQEVRRPLDADELVREAVRDVTRLDRRVFDQRLEHPPWQAIPPVPWGPASPVWSGSTSTGARTAGDVPGVSGGVVETAPRTRDMPPPPPRPPVGDPSSSPTGRGSRSPHTPGRSRIRDTTAVVGDVSDTALFGRTDIDLDSTRPVTEHTARLQPGLGPHDGRMTAAREVAASGCEPQRGRDRGVSADSLEYALMAATRAVHEQTPRKRGVPPRPRPVPTEGEDALGETSGAEGLGMPRGSRRAQTVTKASARVAVLRKARAPITIEEDDPETDVGVREEDEDYEGEEEGEEESERGSDGDDNHDEHEPPPPPPKGAARRRAAQTSSSSRGRRSSTSGTRGGTRRQSGKGKKRR